MTDTEKYVTVRHENGVKILRVDIQQLVDFDVADTVTEELIRAAGNEADGKVVVDMGGVEFLSSVGYTPFLNLRAHLRKRHGHLILANMPEMIHEVFEATRLLISPESPKSLFEYRQSIAAAVDALK